jgi:hypothetical protein
MAMSLIFLLSIFLGRGADPAPSTNSEDILREQRFQSYLAESGRNLLTNLDQAYTNKMRVYFNNIDFDPTSTNAYDVLRAKLFQRFLAEAESKLPSLIPLNKDQSYTNMVRLVFNHIVVDPTFGLAWDEVPAPTLTNSNAMSSVQAFVKSNGWNMATNNIFGEMSLTNPMKPIRGLPWAAVKDREFGAVTCDGILYVLFNGWEFNISGVAYNPRTNKFVPRLSGFKPIGRHWYVWAAGDHPLPLVQQYEGGQAMVGPGY